MKRIKLYKYRDYLCCIVVGMFVISTFSDYFFTKRVGFCAIELILIPLLFVYNRYLQQIKCADIIYSFFIMFILWALSYSFLTSLQFNTILSTVRSYFLFFLAFFLFYRNELKEKDFNTIYTILFISKCGDLLGAVLGLQEKVFTDADSVITNLNILTTPFIISYAYRQKNSIHFLIVCTLCLVASFFSATRGIILYTIINIIMCVLFNKQSISSIIKSVVGIAVLAFAIISIYLASENIVHDYSSNLHYRLYSKVLERNDVVTGDKDREEHFYYLLEHIDEAIIPHGMATRNSDTVRMQSNRMLWAVRDSSLVEIVYTFGFFSVFIIVYILRMAFYYFKRRSENVVYYVMAMLLANLLICLPMGYGLLITPPLVFVLGAEVGAAVRLKK